MVFILTVNVYTHNLYGNILSNQINGWKSMSKGIATKRTDSSPPSVFYKSSTITGLD